MYRDLREALGLSFRRVRSLGLAAALGAVLTVALLSTLGLVPPFSGQQPSSEDAAVRVYRNALPGVVSIVDSSRSTESASLPFLGSGFVVDLDGHVLTNHHVIKDTRHPGIVLADGVTFQADVVGDDPSHDLALLRVDVPRERLHPLRLAESSTLQVGQRVVAIGSPFGLPQSLTSGVVSFVGRPLVVKDGDQPIGTIQTDAAINPGNSGGPLLDLSGRVVGVTALAYNKSIGRFEGGSVGVGFAIPSTEIRRLLPEMVGGSLVTRPWLGLFAEDVGPSITCQDTDCRPGAMVVDVVAGGPVDQAGLLGGRYITTISLSSSGSIELSDRLVGSGDEVLRIDGHAVRSRDDLASYLADSGKRVGEVVVLEVNREGRILELPVRLTARDASQVGAI